MAAAGAAACCSRRRRRRAAAAAKSNDLLLERSHRPTPLTITHPKQPPCASFSHTHSQNTTAFERERRTPSSDARLARGQRGCTRAAAHCDRLQDALASDPDARSSSAKLAPQQLVPASRASERARARHHQRHQPRRPGFGRGGGPPGCRCTFIQHRPVGALARRRDRGERGEGESVRHCWACASPPEKG